MREHFLLRENLPTAECEPKNNATPKPYQTEISRFKLDLEKKNEQQTQLPDTLSKMSNNPSMGVLTET